MLETIKLKILKGKKRGEATFPKEKAIFCLFIWESLYSEK